MELLTQNPARAPRRRPAAALCAVFALLSFAGCQAPQRHATSQPEVPRGNAELVAYLTEQPLVTAEAAYRAVHLLRYREPFEGDFAALASKLSSDGIVRESWGHAAGDYVDRGQVGFMLCRACEIRTGVNWQLTGLGRYAWRELQYLRIAGEGSELARVGGGEFVGLITRAGDYLHEHQRDLPRAELGREEDAP